MSLLRRVAEHGAPGTAPDPAMIQGCLKKLAPLRAAREKLDHEIEAVRRRLAPEMSAAQTDLQTAEEELLEAQIAVDAARTRLGEAGNALAPTRISGELADVDRALAEIAAGAAAARFNPMAAEFVTKRLAGLRANLGLSERAELSALEPKKR